MALIFARKKSRAARGETRAPGRFPSAGDQRTNDTRFSLANPSRVGDAPHLPSVTNYPAPLYHPRAESRLMSYSRERDPLERKEKPGDFPRQMRRANKRERNCSRLSYATRKLVFPLIIWREILIMSLKLSFKRLQNF